MILNLFGLEADSAYNGKECIEKMMKKQCII
jgi:hypothetical protein